MKLYIGLISNNEDNHVMFGEINVFSSTNKQSIESWILCNINAILSTTFTNTEELTEYLIRLEDDDKPSPYFSIIERTIPDVNTCNNTTSIMPIIYIAKIYNADKQIIDVHHYHHFENVIADISDVNNTIFRALSQEERKTLGKMSIMNSSFDDNHNINDDFTIRFENDFSIYIGQIMLKDIVENEKE